MAHVVSFFFIQEYVEIILEEFAASSKPDS